LAILSPLSLHDALPISAVCRCVNLPARRAEIHAARVERVGGHRVAQHVHVTILLRQPFRERFPIVAARLAAIHAQLSVRGEMFRDRKSTRLNSSHEWIS